MKERLTARARYVEGNISMSNISPLFQNTDSISFCNIYVDDMDSTSYLYVAGFNFSKIPSNAIVDSYAVKLKYSQSGNTLPTQKLYYHGESSVSGSSIDIPNNGGMTIYTFPCPHPFSEISKPNFSIRLSFKPTNNIPIRAMFFGCEIEVNYHLGGDLKVKQNGEWKDTVPYVKQNGIWVEQGDYSKIFTLGEWIKKGE